MNRASSLSLLLVATGIALGGGCTYLVHLATVANSNENAKASQRGTELPSSSVVDASSASDSEITNNRQFETLIEDVSEQNASFERKLLVYSYIADLTERQVLKDLQLSREASLQWSRRVLEELQIALVERLAVVNPVAAMEFAVAHKTLGTDFSTLTSGYIPAGSETTPMPVIQSVFEEWALSDRKSAVKNAKSLDADVRDNALAGILATLNDESLKTYRAIARELGREDQALDSYVMSFSTRVVEDPEAVWDEIVQLVKPSRYHHYMAIGNVARQWYQQDGIGVLEEISSGPLDEELKHRAIQQLITFATTENPEQAFQYALTIPSQTNWYTSPLYSVVRTWARSDPQAAYQAVSSMEQGGQRESLQRQVIPEWAMNEPHYVLENLGSFPLQMRDMAFSNAIGAIAHTSPQEAAEMALEQLDGKSGSLSYVPTQIMQYWITQDVEAAVSWVFNGPVSKDQRRNWVSALATNLVHTDPRRAFDIALKQPRAEGIMGFYGIDLEAQIIGQIVMRDFDLAVELLPKVRDGISRAQAYSSVGNKYLDLGDFAKAVDLGLELPTDEQASYFQSISYSWANIDPSGLIESIKNLPSEELRSSVARDLSSQWMKENFTDGQLDTLKQYLSDSDRKALEQQE